MRYIPVIALAALLSSCSLFGGMKAPSFAKEGDEVEYEEFAEAYMKAGEDSELADTESKLGDRVLKYTSSSSEVETWKRGKKELSKSEEQTTGKGEAQFDYGNLVAKITGESKYTEKSSDEEQTYSSTRTSKQEQYYQIGKYDGAKYLLLVNAKTKEYRGNMAVGTQDEEDVFDYSVRSSISSIAYFFRAYMPSSSSEREDYLFYVKDDVLFTYSYDNEDDYDSSEYKCTTKLKVKAQIDLTDKKQAVRLSYERKDEMTYTKDTGSYKDGDVVVIEEKTYAEYTVNAKDVNVKEVDLSDYTEIKNTYYY